MYNTITSFVNNRWKYDVVDDDENIVDTGFGDSEDAAKDHGDNWIAMNSASETITADSSTEAVIEADPEIAKPKAGRRKKSEATD